MSPCQPQLNPFVVQNPSTQQPVTPSIPLYTGSSLAIQCANCYAGLQSAALYIELAGLDSSGFSSAACEADVILVAGLGFAAQITGSGTDLAALNITPNVPLLGALVSVVGITWLPQVSTQLYFVSNLTAGGELRMAAGATQHLSITSGLGFTQGL